MSPRHNAILSLVNVYSSGMPGKMGPVCDAFRTDASFIAEILPRSALVIFPDTRWAFAEGEYELVRTGFS
jgi:hypothetical protein